LVPGRGNQPCTALLERLVRTGWSGAIILEIVTRRARTTEEREADLAEGLAFARLNLATAAADTAYAVSADGTVEQVLRGSSR
jgi:sugar phosphate isomerase/epimerase